ncbi:glycosyltransferase family 4 protein [Roseivirga sp. BDSF3-8]|uniref:glycosyltransferase family 4 protein n=1 Tax=Roseivirga sp. BDSF3-8 TaxID=3241598 RepID=UPI003531CA62
MNILFLTYQGGIAGSTQSIYFLANGLAERGHTILVGCPESSMLYRLLENSAARRVPMTFKGKLDGANMRQIADLTKRYRIELINAQSSRDRYTSMFAKWRYKLPVRVVHTRRQIPKSAGGYLQNVLYHKGTDAVVAVSNGVKKALAGPGMPADHIKVIYNGTPREKYSHYDTGLTQELADTYGITADTPVIGCVSRKKHQDQLLRAIGMLEKKVTAFFIGVDITPEYREIMNHYKVPHTIHFCGRVPADKVLSYYPLFRLNVLPSTIEGLSQSLLESMAMGVPVIATRAAGNPDLIRHEENGLMFGHGNIRELSEQIKQVLEDEGLRSKLIENGYRTALEEFSIENTISNYENFFKTLIEGGSV